MKTRLATAWAAVWLVAAAIPVAGHHSFAAEYDANQPITIKGTLNRVDWVNPHSWIHVDVVGPDGAVTTWKCETAPPNGLFRRGWTKNSFTKGEELTVEGYRAKDGSPTMNARTVILKDGRRMFAGSTGNGAPPREGESEK